MRIIAPVNHRSRSALALVLALAFPAAAAAEGFEDWARPVEADAVIKEMRETQSRPAPAPAPAPYAAFDPAEGAILPNHRIVAFYGIPRARRAGPAYEPTDDMLAKLHKQADEYRKLDPATPVVEGIDLVVNVADGIPGAKSAYSHDLSAATMSEYLDFCQEHDLVLFLDLELGRARLRDVLPRFLPLLQAYPLVHLAIDPEWSFPAGTGVPGTNVGSISADDINYAIRTLAAIPARYRIPRKILVVHQYRASVLPSKESIDRSNPDVSVVLHVDSVGGFAGASGLKKKEYAQWVGREWSPLAGFKLFYDIEKPFHMMTPEEVLALKPAPLVVTYGN